MLYIWIWTLIKRKKNLYEKIREVKSTLMGYLILGGFSFISLLSLGLFIIDLLICRGDICLGRSVNNQNKDCRCEANILDSISQFLGLQGVDASLILGISLIIFISLIVLIVIPIENIFKK